jgi:hypothetical protein
MACLPFHDRSPPAEQHRQQAKGPGQGLVQPASVILRMLARQHMHVCRKMHAVMPSSSKFPGLLTRHVTTTNILVRWMTSELTYIRLQKYIPHLFWPCSASIGGAARLPYCNLQHVCRLDFAHRHQALHLYSSVHTCHKQCGFAYGLCVRKCDAVQCSAVQCKFVQCHSTVQLTKQRPHPVRAQPIMHQF